MPTKGALSLYEITLAFLIFFFSSRRRHTRSLRDWSSDVCSSDLGQMTLEHRHVVVIGNETDFDRLRLFGGDETQLPRGRACLGLGQRADRREHAAHDGAIDAPQEIRLILLPVLAAVPRAVACHRIVSGRDR